MEISKAKKLAREAQMQIDEILNNLANETDCFIQLDVDTHTVMGREYPSQYITDITLTI